MIIFRVDDRLIHGQVVENWLGTFEINHIIVSSSNIINDDLRKNIMKFSVPENILLDFISPAELVKFCFNNNKNYLVLFESLDDVISSVNGGLNIDRLNLGGIHYARGRNFSMGRVIFLSDKEKSILKELVSKNIDVYMQSIPQEASIKVTDNI
jgi:mannose/fructose/N-acetylgalactosamine-specific phosphotransferase system component IIB